MRLYICWGTFPAPWRPGGHPCRNAYQALREPATSRRSCARTGLTPLPDALANRSDGREAARRLTGKSTVPVLELDDGTAIWDSKRIVEWARENPAAA